MRPASRFLLLYTLLFTAHVSLAEGLGPERAVSEPVSRPVTYERVSPAAATDGRDFLVVWTDSSPGEPSTFAALVHEDGTSSEELYIGPSSPNFSKPPVVVWNGTEYIIESSSRLYRVSSRGELLGVAEELVFTSNGPDQAVNRGVAVASLLPSGVVLGRNGRPIASDHTGRILAATGIEEGFLVVSALPCCAEKLTLALIGPDGKTIRSQPLPTGFASAGSIAWSGARGLVVLFTHPKNVAFLIDETLTVRKVIETGRQGYPSVVWDGETFVVTEEAPQSSPGVQQIIVSRISSEGDILPSIGTTAEVAGSYAPDSHSLVTNGRTTLLVRVEGSNYYEGGTLRGSLISRGASASSSIERSFLIGAAPAAQNNPDIATSPAAELIVWGEGGTGDRAVFARWLPRDPSIPSRLLEVGSSRGRFASQPVVTFGNNTFLVVWSDAGVMRSRKVTSEGALAPAVIDAAPSYSPALDVSWNGETYLVVSQGGFAQQLDSNGAAIGSSVQFPTAAIDAAVLAIGNTWYVAWNGPDDRYCQLTCGSNPNAGVYLSRFGSSGQFIDVRPLKLAQLGFAVEIATDMQQLLVTWIEPYEGTVDRIAYARVLPSLKMLDPTRQFLPIEITSHPFRPPPPGGSPNRAVTIFDGKAWSLAWTTAESGGALLSVAALEVDTPLSGVNPPRPITVGALRFRQSLPEPLQQRDAHLAINSRYGRTTIAYVRSIVESRYGKLRRVFFRSLSVASRHRSTRR
ncbi:MAG TPA: hypothetical protein VNM92_05080 [Thermoanaerobaculia bacterium]|nr:hypothetical protein [Thermoanaerobaculia bacterium]